MSARSWFAIAFLAVIAGCESNDPVTPQVDVDAALAEMTTGGASYGNYGMGGFMATPSQSASACAYDAPSGFFTCPPLTSNGITFTRRFQLLDASGAPMSMMNPLAIASIRSVVDVSGTTTATADVPIGFQVTRHEDATLSGLQSPNRLLNGTATSQLIATAEAVAITLNDTTVTTQLQLPSSATQKYPLGGKIVSSGAIHDAPNPVESYRIEMKFDGTSFVTVTATVSGQTWTCRVDMASTSSEPTCS